MRAAIGSAVAGWSLRAALSLGLLSCFPRHQQEVDGGPGFADAGDRGVPDAMANMPDAGPAGSDASTGALDGGSACADGGPGGTDAATPPLDAGPSMMDAHVPPDPDCSMFGDAGSSGSGGVCGDAAVDAGEPGAGCAEFVEIDPERHTRLLGSQVLGTHHLARLVPDRGLVIVDLCDPAAPSVVGTLPLWMNPELAPHAMYVWRTRIILAVYEIPRTDLQSPYEGLSLLLVDAHEPTEPTLVHRLKLEGFERATRLVAGDDSAVFYAGAGPATPGPDSADVRVRSTVQSFQVTDQSIEVVDQVSVVGHLVGSWADANMLVVGVRDGTRRADGSFDDAADRNLTPGRLQLVDVPDMSGGMVPAAEVVLQGPSTGGPRVQSLELSPGQMRFLVHNKQGVLEYAATYDISDPVSPQRVGLCRMYDDDAFAGGFVTWLPGGILRSFENALSAPGHTTTLFVPDETGNCGPGAYRVPGGHGALATAFDDTRFIAFSTMSEMDGFGGFDVTGWALSLFDLSQPTFGTLISDTGPLERTRASVGEVVEGMVSATAPDGTVETGLAFVGPRPLQLFSLSRDTITLRATLEPATVPQLWLRGGIGVVTTLDRVRTFDFNDVDAPVQLGNLSL